MTCRPAPIVVRFSITPVAAAVDEVLTQTTGVAAAAAVNEGDDVD